MKREQEICNRCADSHAEDVAALTQQLAEAEKERDTQCQLRYLTADERDSALAIARQAVGVLEGVDGYLADLPNCKCKKCSAIRAFRAFLSREDVKALKEGER